MKSYLKFVLKETKNSFKSEPWAVYLWFNTVLFLIAILYGLHIDHPSPLGIWLLSCVVQVLFLALLFNVLAPAWDDYIESKAIEIKTKSILEALKILPENNNFNKDSLVKNILEELYYVERDRVGRENKEYRENRIGAIIANSYGYKNVKVEIVKLNDRDVYTINILVWNVK